MSYMDLLRIYLLIEEVEESLKRATVRHEEIKKLINHVVLDAVDVVL